MARYQLTIAYDGTNYCGFQRQANHLSKRTIQSEIESALQKIGWKASKVLAAGRTDSGVHAVGQVLVFDMAWEHSEEALRAAINSNLPGDIAVRDVRIANPSFHPRYDALARRYSYRLYSQPVRDPLRDRFAWRIWPGISQDWIQAAAADLVGNHDFSSFGTPPRIGGSTIRQIYVAEWQFEKDESVFEIVANAFLYRMIRRLVKLQVEIGQGLRSAEELIERLSDNNITRSVGLAPPNGLILVQVIYPDDNGNKRKSWQ